MDQEQRQSLDRALGESVAVGPWAARRQEPPSRNGRRAPSWWRGEEAAAASTLQAARSMGFMVMEQS